MPRAPGGTDTGAGCTSTVEIRPDLRGEELVVAGDNRGKTRFPLNDIVHLNVRQNDPAKSMLAGLGIGVGVVAIMILVAFSGH